MKLLDAAIASVSPRWALQRLQARRAMDLLARSYDGAQHGRRTANWRAPGGSANVTIDSALATLRNRSRDMIRNDPYAARAINGLVSKSVGTGITARTEKSVAKAWKQFTDDCDFNGWFDWYGLQNQAARAAFADGECLIRRVRTRDGFGLRLQVLEADYIDTAKFGQLSGGNFIIAGVEVNPRGQRQALWLFDQHPGEAGVPLRGNTSRRVPIEDVIHFYEQDRPGQLRGVPRLTVAMMKAREKNRSHPAPSSTSTRAKPSASAPRAPSATATFTSATCGPSPWAPASPTSCSPATCRTSTTAASAPA
jgi:lambda family phage portal protein